jgi:hypothetical protein
MTFSAIAQTTGTANGVVRPRTNALKVLEGAMMEHVKISRICLATSALVSKALKDNIATWTSMIAPVHLVPMECVLIQVPMLTVATAPPVGKERIVIQISMIAWTLHVLMESVLILALNPIHAPVIKVGLVTTATKI